MIAIILLSILKLRPLPGDVPTTSEVFHRLCVAATHYLMLADRPLFLSTIK
jgi:hypothetical protein